MVDVQKITFEDSNQDFTEFYVRNGIVIDCQPMQGRVWVGTRVLGDAKVGQLIEIVTRSTGRECFLQHKVESVETLERSKALEAESAAHEWARMLNIAPAQLGM